MRLLIRLLLSLVLATTSVTSAVMHSEMQGGTEMVICADSVSGSETITLDALGNPIPRMHPCPDCLSAHGLAVWLADAGPSAPQSQGRTLSLPKWGHSAGLVPPAASARSPPAFA
jgi:hypothetical protein